VTSCNTLIAVRPWLAGVAVVSTVLMLSGCGGDNEQEPEVARCSSTANDPNDLGLRSTTLRTVDDGLEVTWTRAKPMPQKGTVLYSVSVASEDGNVAGQLGVDYIDGADEGIFVYYIDEDEQTNVDGTAEHDGLSVRAVFPSDTIERLGTPFKWNAGFSHDAQDDDCPDPRGDEAGAMLTFPS
jgi:hypothetical protein